MINTMNFPNILNKLEKIKVIFDEYYYEDLIRAVYSININVNNRSCLESCLALNMGLKECDNRGSKRIRSYYDFIVLFEKLEKYLQPSIMDDVTCEDFGEVKINYREESYKILIGTGHSQVFGCMHFLSHLAKIVYKELELQNIYKYLSNTISFFEKVNKNDMYEEIRFVIPSKELFEKTNDYFDIELKKYNLENISKELERSNLLIEKLHFINKNSKIFPLFNSSLLVDIYDNWYSKINDENRINLASFGVFEMLSKICKLDQGENPKVLFPVALVDNGELISKSSYEFMTSSEKGIIIGINNDYFTEAELNEEIKKIKSLHFKNKLNLVETISRNKNKNHIGFNISKDMPLLFIVFNSFTNISDMNLHFGKNSNEYLKCTALDVIYMLAFMDNFDEIGEYLVYDSDKEFSKMFLFGGNSSKFLAWKENNYMMAKGAIKFGMVNISHNLESEYVYNYYKNELSSYPWGIDDYIISSPFAWNIEELEEGYFQYVNKVNSGFGGLLKVLNNNCLLFFVHNMEFYSTREEFIEYKEAIHLVDDLNIRKIKRCERIFEESERLSNKTIQIMFMPEEYAVLVRGDNLFENFDRKYVYSDMNIYENKILIRYSVDIEELYQDIMNASNRSVENIYFKELLLPLKDKYFIEYQKIIDKLDEEKNLKKEIDVFSTQLDYFWEENMDILNIKDKTYLDVKKMIAKECYSNNINPGEYFGIEANSIIRKMQGQLIETFENMIEKYDRLDLYKKLMSIYSNTIHLINIHSKRYNSFTNIEEDVLSEIKGKTIKYREEEKHNSRILQYIIESNIFLERDGGDIITTNQLEFLLAYSNWLVVLSDNADICYFTEEDSYIKINFEYVVDVYLNEEQEGKYKDLVNRVYDFEDYAIIGDDVDKQYFKIAKKAFEDDTGIKLENIINFFDFLQISFIDYNYKKIGNNIFKMKKNDIIKWFKKYLESSIKEKEIIKIINFLTINPSDLKKDRGQVISYLPIGERKYRDQRIEVKPLLKDNEYILFSPVTIKDIHSKWINGILDFYLPYEIGMENLKALLVDWKRRYEKNIVYAVKEIFIKNGYSFIKTDLELCKIDKENNHPQYLGDYDVFVIDEKGKEIFIIECKVLEKVANIFEMYRQQNRFFNEHEDDEKFQRRIDYLNKHYEEILRCYNFDDSQVYKITPIMVFNKVMLSRYKEVRFPIIGFGELDSFIKRNLSM